MQIVISWYIYILFIHISSNPVVVFIYIKQQATYTVARQNKSVKVFIYTYILRNIPTYLLISNILNINKKNMEVSYFMLIVIYAPPTARMC